MILLPSFSISVELLVVPLLFKTVLSTNTSPFIVVVEIVVGLPIFKLSKEFEEVPIFPLILLVPMVVIFPSLFVVVIFPEKLEFNIILPFCPKFRVPVPEDKETLLPKVAVSVGFVVFIFIEPAVTAPPKFVFPFISIFPFSISVEPETVLEPLKIKLAL